MAAPIKSVRLLTHSCKKNNNNYNTRLVFLHLRHVHADRNVETVATQHFEEKKFVPEAIGAKLGVWMKLYEDVLGIAEIKAAQNKVIATEAKLLENQEIRRGLQAQTQEVKMRLKEINLELDKTLRGEDRYLQLVTQEHTVLQDERQLSEQMNLCEKAERDYFMALSSAVRDSHERQRHYAEKTKYWSIIGSVCGTIIGILGTSLNNRARVRELRDAVLKLSEEQSDSRIRAIYSQLQEEMIAKSQPEHGSGDAGADTSRDDFVCQELADIKELLTTHESGVVVTDTSRDDFIRQELADIKEQLTTHQFVVLPEATVVKDGLESSSSFKSKVLWCSSGAVVAVILLKMIGL